MEIIIGRDAQTRQLNVVKDGVSKKFGQPGSVPMDVSRQHFSLSPAGTGRWLIKNLNAQNVTFVNGVAVESKTISEGDKVEIGNSHYLFQWQAIQEPKVETVDIRPLKRIWEDYKEKKDRLKNHQKNLTLISSVPIAFTMIGGVFTSIAPDEYRPMAIIFTIIAAIIMVYGLYNRKNDDSSSKIDELDQQFKLNYKCPKCGRSLPPNNYNYLVQNYDACPYCKTKFIK